MMANPEIKDVNENKESENKNDNPKTETLEDVERRVLDEINNSEDSGKTALNIIDKGNSQDVYYVIRNIGKFENKLDSKMEKDIIIKAIKKGRQPGSVLGHWENFELLSKEDKKEIAQAFVDCGDIHILSDCMNEGTLNIDEETKDIFSNVILSREKYLDEILSEGWGDPTPNGWVDPTPNGGGDPTPNGGRETAGDGGRNAL